MRKTDEEDSTQGAYKGYYFFRNSGIINIVIGTTGAVLVNLLLRDNEIVTQSFVWIALGGFLLMMFYGTYCIYKMITSTNP